MTTPGAIDILCIAAGLKHRAMERYLAAQTMQHSPAAAQTAEAAWLDVVLASVDVERAQRVATEIAAGPQEAGYAP